MHIAIQTIAIAGQTESTASVIFMKRVRILNIIFYNLTNIH